MTRISLLVAFLLVVSVSVAAGAAPVPSPEVEIINLYDAFGKDRSGTTESFGFSALVRIGETTILFDAGTRSDILEANAEALEIDLSEVDFAVASHAHADHVGGFDALIRVNPDVTIYFPSDFFGAGGPLNFSVAGTDPGAKEQLPEEHRYFNGETDLAELRTDGRFYKAVEYVDDSRQIANGIRLVATRSTNIGYFTKYPGVDLEGNWAEGEASFLGLPELSLSIDTAEGLVLVVGCAHSGVEPIVRAAREEVESDIALLVGGYHLLPYDRATIEGVVTRLREKHMVRQVAPAHCSGHLAFIVLREIYGDDYRFFGLGSVVAR